MIRDPKVGDKVIYTNIHYKNIKGKHGIITEVITKVVKSIQLVRVIINNDLYLLYNDDLDYYVPKYIKDWKKRLDHNM